MEQYIVKEDDGTKSIFIFVPNFLSSENLIKMKQELDNIDDWKTTTKFDSVTVQRKQKWFQTNNKPFGKNWKYNYERWQPNNYSDYLLNFQTYIQESVDMLTEKDNSINKPSINSLLINYYETGNNCIAAHQDDKGSFGL